MIYYNYLELLIKNCARSILLSKKLSQIRLNLSFIRLHSCNRGDD